MRYEVKKALALRRREGRENISRFAVKCETLYRWSTREISRIHPSLGQLVTGALFGSTPTRSLAGCSILPPLRIN